MARLIFSKPPKKYKNYKDYKPWLEENSYPNFCGYSWLVDQSSLSIDHYKPKEHYAELKNDPDNLILCTSGANASKGDYHPEAKNRKVFKNEDQAIFNCRKEDVGEYVKVELDGTLICRSCQYKDRFNFNAKVFKFNRYHSRGARKEYFSFLKDLCDLYIFVQSLKRKRNAQNLRKMEYRLKTLKEYCSRRLIFYKLLNITIPREIEKLLTNQTKAKFI